MQNSGISRDTAATYNPQLQADSAEVSSWPAFTTTVPPPRFPTQRGSHASQSVSRNPPAGVSRGPTWSEPPRLRAAPRVVAGLGQPPERAHWPRRGAEPCLEPRWEHVLGAGAAVAAMASLLWAGDAGAADGERLNSQVTATEPGRERGRGRRSELAEGNLRGKPPAHV